MKADKASTLEGSFSLMGSEYFDLRDSMAEALNTNLLVMMSSFVIPDLGSNPHVFLGGKRLPDTNLALLKKLTTNISIQHSHKNISNFDYVKC